MEIETNLCRRSTGKGNRKDLHMRTLQMEIKNQDPICPRASAREMIYTKRKNDNQGRQKMKKTRFC